MKRQSPSRWPTSAPPRQRRRHRPRQRRRAHAVAAAEKRDAALDVLRTVLQAPRFEGGDLRARKARTVAGLKEALTRPDSIAGKAFWAAMYPDHPYGRTATGIVAALTRDDLVAHHSRYYTAANGSITLVGDIGRAEAEGFAGR